jgi:ABC-type transporter Mla MlaB component
MIRITQTGNGSGPRTLRVAGRLAEPWVDELARVSELALGQPGALAVDLSEVTFVDAPGAALLRSLARRGVGMIGASTFVAAVMDGGTT